MAAREPALYAATNANHLLGLLLRFAAASAVSKKWAEETAAAWGSVDVLYTHLSTADGTDPHMAAELGLPAEAVWALESRLRGASLECPIPPLAGCAPQLVRLRTVSWRWLWVGPDDEAVVLESRRVPGDGDSKGLWWCTRLSDGSITLRSKLGSADDGPLMGTAAAKVSVLSDPLEFATAVQSFRQQPTASTLPTFLQLLPDATPPPDTARWVGADRPVPGGDRPCCILRPADPAERWQLPVELLTVLQLKAEVAAATTVQRWWRVAAGSERYKARCAEAAVAAVKLLAELEELQPSVSKSAEPLNQVPPPLLGAPPPRPLLTPSKGAQAHRRCHR